MAKIPDNTKETRDEKGRFLPGVCTNPGGRPKTWEGFRERLNEAGPKLLEEAIRIALDKKHKHQVQVLLKLLDKMYPNASEQIQPTDANAVLTRVIAAVSIPAPPVA